MEQFDPAPTKDSLDFPSPEKASTQTLSENDKIAFERFYNERVATINENAFWNKDSLFETVQTDPELIETLLCGAEEARGLIPIKELAGEAVKKEIEELKSLAQTVRAHQAEMNALEKGSMSRKHPTEYTQLIHEHAEETEELLRIYMRAYLAKLSKQTGAQIDISATGLLRLGYLNRMKNAPSGIEPVSILPDHTAEIPKEPAMNDMIRKTDPKKEDEYEEGRAMNILDEEAWLSGSQRTILGRALNEKMKGWVRLPNAPNASDPVQMPVFLKLYDPERYVALRERLDEPLRVNKEMLEDELTDNIEDPVRSLYAAEHLALLYPSEYSLKAFGVAQSDDPQNNLRMESFRRVMEHIASNFGTWAETEHNTKTNPDKWDVIFHALSFAHLFKNGEYFEPGDKNSAEYKEYKEMQEGLSGMEEYAKTLIDHSIKRLDDERAKDPEHFVDTLMVGNFFGARLSFYLSLITNEVEIEEGEIKLSPELPS